MEICFTLTALPGLLVINGDAAEAGVVEAVGGGEGEAQCGAVAGGHEQVFLQALVVAVDFEQAGPLLAVEGFDEVVFDGLGLGLAPDHRFAVGVELAEGEVAVQAGVEDQLDLAYLDGIRPGDFEGGG